MVKTVNQKYPELWVPRPKVRRIPITHMLNPDNPEEMIPDPDIMPLFEEGFEALNNGLSLREVQEYINSRLPKDKSVSHTGLKIIWGNLYRTRPIGPRIVKEPKGKTPAERKELRRRHKIAQEKKRLKFIEKRINRYNNQIEQIKEEEILKTPVTGLAIAEEVEGRPVEEKEVIFKPNEGPQTDFLTAWEQEVLYGGAAGGGKSYAMLADPIRYFGNPNFRGLLIRRTNDELKELKWKSQTLYGNKLIKGTWREKDSLWRFPSGGELWMTYLEQDKDVHRYQGQSFTWIGIDELTQYSTPHAWTFLSSRLRSTDPTIPLSMRATTNPGGPGHGWVKKMFIDPAPFNTTFDALNIETDEVMVFPDTYPINHPKAGQPHPQAGKPLFQRRFIPASLYDNPYLTQDSSYEASLLSLPEDMKRKLLYGDWDVAEGAAFSEFRRDVHVVKPFDIPPSWRRFRSCDYGYSSNSAVHWYAIDPDNTLYVYRELYVTKKTGQELAQMILNAERSEKIIYGVLDSSVWAMRGHNGPSIAEEMIAAGCRWRPSDRAKGSRTAGKNRLHQLLRVDPVTNKPGILFFDNCRRIISDLPVIPADPDGDDDIDDKYTHDHAYDSIRYGIMTRPRPNDPWSPQDFSLSQGRYSPADARFGY